VAGSANGCNDLPVASHVMTAESAVAILAVLDKFGVDGCVGGGWGADALLGEQTREHSDLDLWLDASAIEPLFAALTDLDIDPIFPWPVDRPRNFVSRPGACPNATRAGAMEIKTSHTPMAMYTTNATQPSRQVRVEYRPEAQPRR
jgi:hypothetical protein